MIHKKPEIKVFVALTDYLLRLGILALISHLGFEPVYIEIDDFNDLPNDNEMANNFLIIHYKKLNKPKQQHLQGISNNFKGKILVIGNDKMDQLFHESILLPTDSETEMVEKMQDYFASSGNNNSTTENGILSSREIDILKEVALGYSNKEIADHLFISINTVITHRKNITEKLGIKTIPGLTVYALMNKFISPEDVTF